MLPPSPHVLQAHHNGQTGPSRGPLASIPFSMPRDLPSLSTSVANRPSSSMSISSMLDSNNSKSSREPGSINNSAGPSSVVGNFLASPTRQSNSVTSPQKTLPGGNIFPERSSSPDRYKLFQAPSTRPDRSFSGGVEHRPPSFVASNLPEYLDKGSSRANHASQPSPGSIPDSRADWTTSQFRQAYQNGRPSSQSSDKSMSRNNGERRLGSDEAEKNGQQKHVRRQYIDLEEPNNGEPLQLVEAAKDPQDIVQQQPQPTLDMRLSQAEAGRSPERSRLNGSNHIFPSQPKTTPEKTNLHRPEIGRILDRGHHFSNAGRSPYSPDALRRLREERQILHQQDSAQSLANHHGRTNNHLDDRQGSKYPGPPVKFADSSQPPSFIDINEQQQSREESIPNNRGALALFLENSKKEGRFSPLPQAVQGAQGRTSGPASDPGIKNEFGRPFAGIGSGVGSAGPAGSGTNTPFPPPSPEPQRRTPFANRIDLTIGPKSRTASKNSRKPRRVRDDEARADGDDVGRDTPIATVKAVKRSRGAHHHHPHHVHHGHRHHNIDDIQATDSAITPSLSNGRRVNTPSQAGAGSHRHHAHHHGSHHAGAHHHHHHHQEPKPPKIPNTIIKNDAVFESIRLRPSQHLGTVMYASILEPATAKFGYRSTPCPMPRYDGRENCTYTIRNPRLSLEPHEREEICRLRALWGPDIYTDDSDVLAAAMHSGWVRSEFGDDIDPVMLEVQKSGKAEKIKSRKRSVPQFIFDSPPEEPMDPPPGKDLHLTLRVMPTLERYASQVAHGIKSRPWGDTHDGVSYRIERVEWVCEDGRVAEERGGEGRRKRLKARFEGDLKGSLDVPSVRMDVGIKGAGGAVEVAVGA